MKLRDDKKLLGEVVVLLMAHNGRSRVSTAAKILDAVERHQQAALPAAGGACCEKGAKLKEEWVSRYKCPTHGWQVARTVPPPPVSGSPQAGEGRPPKQDCVHGRYNCELCSWVTGLPGELVESVATNTPGSPPVDPSDPTKGEPT